MQRRKFIVGVGSIAASTAAAIGTGAFSSASAERAVSASITADEAGFLTLSANEESLDNGDYSSGTGEGMLELHFDSDAGLGGSGLTNNSEYYFDNVFQVLNKGNRQVQISVDKSGLDNPDAFRFYWTYTNGDGITDYRDLDMSNSPHYSNSPPGHGVNVGVYIDTHGQTIDEDWETGTIDINAVDGSE